MREHQKFGLRHAMDSHDSTLASGDRAATKKVILQGSVMDVKAEAGMVHPTATTLERQCVGFEASGEIKLKQHHRSFGSVIFFENSKSFHGTQEMSQELVRSSIISETQEGGKDAPQWKSNIMNLIYLLFAEYPVEFFQLLKRSNVPQSESTRALGAVPVLQASGPPVHVMEDHLLSGGDHRFSQPVEWLLSRAQQEPTKPRLIEVIEAHCDDDADSCGEACLTTLHISSHYITELMAANERPKRIIFTWLFTLLISMVFLFMAGEYQSWLNLQVMIGGKYERPELGPVHFFKWASPLQAGREYSFLPGFVVLWGGRYLPRIQGEEWRWLSSLLIHENMPHIVSNLILFFILSMNLERRLGFWRITAISLSCGLAGNFLSALLEGPCQVVVGASGVTFGLAGVYLIHICANFNGIRYPVFQLAGLMMLWALTLTHHASNISHLGGFACGAMLGLGAMPNAVSEKVQTFLPAAIFITGAFFLGILPGLVYCLVLPDITCQAS